MDYEPQILTKLSSKAIVSQPVQNTQNLFYGMANKNVALVDVEHGKILHEGSQVHQARISCMRFKDNLLFTGAHDNLIKIFDTRNWSIVHTFQKIPGKFNSIDKSEHILAGATGTNIVFWDLRKMKQRSQFKQSFNGEVTYIRFEDQVCTNLMGCSLDGMINMFELTQPNEQDAFNWCHKIMESPAMLSTARGGRTLVRTIDHNIYKIQDGDLYGKISPNNSDSPKHILYSHFTPNSDFQKYEYFTWSPQQKVIELWKGRFLDKNNSQKCSGYLNQVDDIQILDILYNQEGKRIGVYTDEIGNVFVDYFSKEKRSKENHEYNEFNKQTIQASFSKMLSLQKKQNSKKQQPMYKSNKNGYLLQKPASSFSNHKKFKPY